MNEISNLDLVLLIVGVSIIWFIAGFSISGLWGASKKLIKLEKQVDDLSRLIAEKFLIDCATKGFKEVMTDTDDVAVKRGFFVDATPYIKERGD